MLMKQIIKWSGGKESELSIIHQYAPSNFNNYYEPFVGGGSVFLSFNDAKQLFINDKSAEMFELYKNIKENNSNFFYWLTKLDSWWCYLYECLINEESRDKSISNIYRMRNNSENEDEVSQHIIKFIGHTILNGQSDLFKFNIGDDNYDNLNSISVSTFYSSILSALKRKFKFIDEGVKDKKCFMRKDICNISVTAIMGSFYMAMRELFNMSNEVKELSPSLYSAIWVFIRNYSYNGMFRYSKNGKFNVPYRGQSYNAKLLKNKIDFYQSNEMKELMSKTEISNLDFEEFLNRDLNENDFVFLDPPYDTTFSTYETNEFSRDDHIRLANCLYNMKAKWMMVIKETDFIRELYDNKDGINIIQFGKKYKVNFKNRNDKNVVHLVIKNY